MPADSHITDHLHVWRLRGRFDGRAIDADKDGRPVCPHNIAGPLCFAGDVSVFNINFDFS